MEPHTVSVAAAAAIAATAAAAAAATAAAAAAAEAASAAAAAAEPIGPVSVSNCVDERNQSICPKEGSNLLPDTIKELKTVTWFVSNGKTLHKPDLTGKKLTKKCANHGKIKFTTKQAEVQLC